jgi:hypothetical protein
MRPRLLLLLLSSSRLAGLARGDLRLLRREFGVKTAAGRKLLLYVELRFVETSGIPRYAGHSLASFHFRVPR